MSVDELFELFAERGRAEYFGEPVSTTEHSLQAAAMAERAGSSDALIAAALLHDVGHFLHAAGEECAERGIDDEHEELGAKWLAGLFGAQVTGPVRLHVQAKRFFCKTEPGYHAGLSRASVLSLGLQGGVMSAVEAATFLKRPGARAALDLRRWDDAAKVKGARTPELDAYRPLLTRLAARHSRPESPAGDFHCKPSPAIANDRLQRLTRAGSNRYFTA